MPHSEALLFTDLPLNLQTDSGTGRRQKVRTTTNKNWRKCMGIECMHGFVTNCYYLMNSELKNAGGNLGEIGFKGLEGYRMFNFSVS